MPLYRIREYWAVLFLSLFALTVSLIFPFVASLIWFVIVRISPVGNIFLDTIFEILVITVIVMCLTIIFYPFAIIISTLLWLFFFIKHLTMIKAEQKNQDIEMHNMYVHGIYIITSIL